MNKLLTTIFVILSFGIILYLLPTLLLRKTPEKPVEQPKPQESRYEPSPEQIEFEKNNQVKG